MTVINKSNVARPVPPKEVLDVPELGGEVIVRGLMLSERVRLLHAATTSSLSISELLSYTVIDAENESIFNTEEWEAFGANHFTVALDLFKKAKQLSGLDLETNQKK
jgi:hypothetical protein